MFSPIVFSILAMVITYIYLYWDSKKNNKQINYLIILIIGASVWFICSIFFSDDQESGVFNLQQLKSNNIKLPQNDVFIDIAKF